jgi:hypothetical protein
VTVRLMSDGELSRLEVLRDLDQKRLTTAAAGQLLGLERRQVFRLLKTYRTEGATGLISKRRGRRSNRRKPEALRRAVLAMIREWYWDFGPTLAAEKLREVHGIALGRETLRLWMIEAGLWLDRKQRRKCVHQPRSRRDCVGELVQVARRACRCKKPPACPKLRDKHGWHGNRQRSTHSRQIGGTSADPSHRQ